MPPLNLTWPNLTQPNLALSYLILSYLILLYLKYNQSFCQGQPQLASPLMMTKGFEVLDGVMVDLSI